jgi:acetyl esterase/lipase
MSDVRIREGVVFGTGGGRDLRCDVYSPADARGELPGLILLHPGGWREGNRGMMRETAMRIAPEGYVCIAGEYRLTPEAPWPAQIEDVKAAIRWAHAQSADLGIDPGRIGAVGRSAGGHLALLAAGTAAYPEFAGSGGNQGASEELAAVVAIFPPTVLTIGDEVVRGGHPAHVLMGDRAQADAARMASPLTHVAGLPPTFLIHGTADQLVPPAASEVLFEALVQAGIPAELHMYAEQPHAFAGKPEFIDLVCAESVHFLRRYLTPEAAARATKAAASA